jgi:medium-chain acyl-[acyl-carrier-protein] hydrolase
MKTSLLHNNWVTCSRPKPQATLRLFCFHYAGGGAAIFRTWSDSLPSSVEVCAIELPGRGMRLKEPPFTQLEPLVQHLASALFPYLDKPFAFFGHSMGGLVSFELTRLLRREYGVSPVHLFVSGIVHLKFPIQTHLFTLCQSRSSTGTAPLQRYTGSGIKECRTDAATPSYSASRFCRH